MIRGQRVRRVIRSIDTWSVLRVAVLFYLSLMLVIVLAGVMLWVAGSVFGAVDGMESFMRGIGFDGFEFVGGQLLRGFTALGLILVVLGTGATVLAAILYNLIADVVGGIQLSVLEEVYVPEEGQADVVVDADGGTWLVPAADAADAEGVPTPEEEEAAAAYPVATPADDAPTDAALTDDAPTDDAPTEDAPVAAQAEVLEPEQEREAAIAEPVGEPVAKVDPEPVAGDEGGDQRDDRPEAVADRASTPTDRPSSDSSSSPNGWSSPSWEPSRTSSFQPNDAGGASAPNG